MLKKIMMLCVASCMIFLLSGCSDNSSQDAKETPTTTDSENKPREFTEAKGTIKYLTIDGNKVALPETVGEYVGYLEKLGTVKIGATKEGEDDILISEAPQMEANERASLASTLNVYVSNKEYQSFGINYVNTKGKKANVSDATVTRISLIYDIYADTKVNPGDQTIKTMVLVTDKGEIAINGKTTSGNIIKILGNPTQNTDGYLKYTDDAGYTYKFATENQKGILTKVQIDYPKN